MKKRISFILAMLLMFISFIGFENEAEAQGQGGYITASNGAVTDTVASNSANDTSLVFRNTAGYPVLDVELKQNGQLDKFTISETDPLELRILYVAADSSIRVQKRGYLGWFPVLLDVNGSTVTKYPLTLRTGNAILTVRGRKE